MWRRGRNRSRRIVPPHCVDGAAGEPTSATQPPHLVKFNFEPGHTYELGIKNMLDGRLILRDKTVKREVIVQQ